MVLNCPKIIQHLPLPRLFPRLGSFLHVVVSCFLRNMRNLGKKKIQQGWRKNHHPRNGIISKTSPHHWFGGFFDWITQQVSGKVWAESRIRRIYLESFGANFELQKRVLEAADIKRRWTSSEGYQRDSLLSLLGIPREPIVWKLHVRPWMMNDYDD